VVVKKPRDANGKTLNAWKAILIRFRNDNDAGFWKFDSGSVTHASQEEALGYMLEQLQIGGFRGIVERGSGLSDGEQEGEEHVGEEERGEQS
jgi:hypothetical protein